MKIIDNRALKLRLRDPSRVLDVIPKSAPLGNNKVLVHWDLDNAMVLKNLGVRRVPSPIAKDYDWPGMFPPMKHQIITAGFLTLNKRAYCFNDPGTGKTMSAIWAADYLMEKEEIKRVLVICPLSTMQTAWQADLFKTAMHRSVGIAHGTRAQRLKVLEQDPEFVIINPDGVGTIKEPLQKQGFDLVIIDEATCIKNASTARWRNINSLIKPDTWLWMLTGTPAAQSPLDAYGMARMMNKDTAPRSMSAWRDQVMFKVTQFKWLPKEGWKDRVHDLLQPAIRFNKEQCTDLPPKTYITRRVEMSKSQQQLYDTVRTQLAVSAGGELITAANAAAGMSKLLQISSGSAYTNSGETLDFDIKERFNELCSVIDEAPNKVLVFIPFRNSIERLYEDLTEKGYTCEVIQGGVPLSRRTKIINKFQEEEDPRVLLLQPNSISHGVTLHAADTSVWWGPVMSFETYAQANDRMHRTGQKNPCVVVHLESSPVERVRFRALTQKGEDQESLLDMYKEVLGI